MARFHPSSYPRDSFPCFLVEMVVNGAIWVKVGQMGEKGFPIENHHSSDSAEPVE